MSHTNRPVMTSHDQVSAQPLWLYRWVPGVSLKIGAIVRDGKTLYGPVLKLAAKGTV